MASRYEGPPKPENIYYNTVAQHAHRVQESPSSDYEPVTHDPIRDSIISSEYEDTVFLQGMNDTGTTQTGWEESTYDDTLEFRPIPVPKQSKVMEPERKMLSKTTTVKSNSEIRPPPISTTYNAAPPNPIPTVTYNAEQDQQYNRDLSMSTKPLVQETNFLGHNYEETFPMNNQSKNFTDNLGLHNETEDLDTQKTKTGSRCGQCCVRAMVIWIVLLLMLLIGAAVYIGLLQTRSDCMTARIEVLETQLGIIGQNNSISCMLLPI